MRRFKTVEELNMEQVVELTVEEKTQAFKEWLNQILESHETGLYSTIHRLEQSLNQGVSMSHITFNDMFKLEYYFINEDVKKAICRCKAEQLPENIQVSAIEKLKMMKNKVRKTKSEYKQKFIELEEAISQVKEDEDYVNKVRNQVQDIIAEWCNTYVIFDKSKSYFAVDVLPMTVDYVTDWVLSIKLNLSDEEVVKWVEYYMERHTETVAVTEVKHSQEYNRCEVEVRGIYNSINNLIWSVQRILTDVIPAKTVDEVGHLYQESLMKAIHFAIEDVEQLIQKHNVTSKDEVNALRTTIEEAKNNALSLFAQG